MVGKFSGVGACVTNHDPFHRSRSYLELACFTCTSAKTLITGPHSKRENSGVPSLEFPLLVLRSTPT